MAPLAAFRRKTSDTTVHQEVRLVHEGGFWIASNKQFEARASSIGELDERLEQLYRESGDYAPGTSIRIFMGFDFDTIPTWLRQYHNHYFNRTLSFVV